MENMKGFFASLEEMMTRLGRGRVLSDILPPEEPSDDVIPEGTVLPEGLEHLNPEETTTPPAISD